MRETALFCVYYYFHRGTLQTTTYTYVAYVVDFCNVNFSISNNTSSGADVVQMLEKAFHQVLYCCVSKLLNYWVDSLLKV